MSPAVGVPIGPVEGSRRRKPKRRQVPNGAKCRTARNAEEREKPKSAEPAERRRSPLLPPFRHPARRVAFRAVRHFALSAFGAVRLFARSGIWRRSVLRRSAGHPCPLVQSPLGPLATA